VVSRIVVISDQSMARGGAEALAIASVILFREASLNVTFFVGDDGIAPELKDTGAEIVAVNNGHNLKARKLNAITNGLYAPASRRVMAAWIAVHDDEGVVYHVHSWSKLLSPALFDALKPVRRRVIIHAHDFFMICPNGAFMNFAREEPCELIPMSAACITTNCDKNNYAEKLWRVARQKIREILFDAQSPPLTYLLVHRGMARFFQAVGIADEQLHVVPNPIDAPLRDRVQAEHNTKICFIGRLDPEKGAWDAALAARGAGVALTIIGDGVQRMRIETEFPDVEITGWCTPAQVTAHLQTARLLVVPSRWRETFGMVVVEALRLGIPVIVSAKALIAADVAASGAGLAADTEDIAAFTALLRRLSQDGAAVQAMSEKAQAAASQLTLTPQEWRDSLLSHYERVLARATSPVP
jgi:glycosyltransferase involved in cell wall biosynthesis